MFINVLLAALLCLSLPLYLGCVTVLCQLLISAWIGRRHHALFGPELSLELAAGTLKLFHQLPDGRRLGQSVSISDCHWLGRNMLAAYIEPVSTSRRARLYAFFDHRWLLLVADNSVKADRHRLAMFYHSGVAE